MYIRDNKNGRLNEWMNECRNDEWIKRNPLLKKRRKANKYLYSSLCWSIFIYIRNRRQINYLSALYRERFTQIKGNVSWKKAAYFLIGPQLPIKRSYWDSPRALWKPGGVEHQSVLVQALRYNFPTLSPMFCRHCVS